MKSLFITAAAVAALATSAAAQAPPNGPGPGQSFQPPGMGAPHPGAPGPMGGPAAHRPPPPGGSMGAMMMDNEMMEHHKHPPRPEGAHFKFTRGDNTIDVKCADDEPMRACVDAAGTLLDKVASMNSQNGQNAQH